MQEHAQISRKQFLVFIGSILGVFLFGKIINMLDLPNHSKRISKDTENNSYGNNLYGGNKKQS